MGEGWLRHFANRKAEIYSAGIETHGVNPKAIQYMKEAGIDISSHTSNNVNEYLQVSFDIILTVCDHAKENCPYIPSNAKRFHHNFSDPSKVMGSEEENAIAFRTTRDEIKEYCKKLLEDNI
jgi:arsenate reductase